MKILSSPRAFLHRAAILFFGAFGFAGVPRADMIGNDLKASFNQGSDEQPKLALFNGIKFAIFSPGTVAAAQVFEGATKSVHFSLLLLLPLGSNRYKVVKNEPFTTSGTPRAISLPLDWKVTQSQTLGYWGEGGAYNGTGITGAFYSTTNAAGNPTFTAEEPNVVDTCTLAPNNHQINMPYVGVGGTTRSILPSAAINA